MIRAGWRFAALGILLAGIFHANTNAFRGDYLTRRDNWYERKARYTTLYTSPRGSSTVPRRTRRSPGIPFLPFAAPFNPFVDHLATGVGSGGPVKHSKTEEVKSGHKHVMSQMDEEMKKMGIRMEDNDYDYDYDYSDDDEEEARRREKEKKAEVDRQEERRRMYAKATTSTTSAPTSTTAPTTTSSTTTTISTTTTTSSTTPVPTTTRSSTTSSSTTTSTTPASTTTSSTTTSTTPAPTVLTTTTANQAQNDEAGRRRLGTALNNVLENTKVIQSGAHTVVLTDKGYAVIKRGKNGKPVYTVVKRGSGNDDGGRAGRARARAWIKKEEQRRKKKMEEEEEARRRAEEDREARERAEQRRRIYSRRPTTTTTTTTTTTPSPSAHSNACTLCWHCLEIGTSAECDRLFCTDCNHVEHIRKILQGRVEESVSAVEEIPTTTPTTTTTTTASTTTPAPRAAEDKSIWTCLAGSEDIMGRGDCMIVYSILGSVVASLLVVCLTVSAKHYVEVCASCYSITRKMRQWSRHFTDNYCTLKNRGAFIQDDDEMEMQEQEGSAEYVNDGATGSDNGQPSTSTTAGTINPTTSSTTRGPRVNINLPGTNAPKTGGGVPDDLLGSGGGGDPLGAVGGGRPSGSAPGDDGVDDLFGSGGGSLPDGADPSGAKDEKRKKKSLVKKMTDKML